MSLRKPLAFGADGRPEEMGTGDTVDAAVNSKDVISLTNKNASTITLGQPVYPKTTASQVDLARANASGTKNVIGLVAEATVAADASGMIQTDGVITGSTADWDAVTGLTGGLVPGNEYWLSASTAGMLTSSVPGAGSYLVRIGTAISATEMELSIEYVGKKA